MISVMDRRRAGWLAGALLLAATAGCERNSGASAKTAAAPPPPTEVVVAAVEQRPVSIVRDFTARTEAVPTVEVRARVPGVLDPRAVRSRPRPAPTRSRLGREVPL